MGDRQGFLNATDSITIGDLRPWHVLRAKCAKCGRTAELPVKSFMRMPQHRDRLSALQARLRCTKCNAIGRNRLAVSLQER